MFTLSPSTLATLTAVVLPLLVGLVVKAQASARVKVVANIVLNAVAFVLLNAVNDAGVAVLTWSTLGLFVQQVAIALAAYLGIYKPLDANARLLPDSGLGTPAPAAPPGH